MVTPVMASKMPYRPEVDGLRTVAVLLVILHHLGWAAVSGGYVGVDVFFVISGYLITGLLLVDLRHGRFSLAHFYRRRIIRLAPAYFLVLAVTSLAALIWMLPAELLNYATSALYSTFFLANFYMWHEVGGYFGAQSDVVPLLHLWSLAVEEQFYLLWPLLLFGAWRVLGRGSLALFVLIGVIAGAIVSEWGVQNYRAAAYYLLPTRFFELMIGALVAVVPPLSTDDRRWRLARELLSLTGFAFIAYSATQFTTQRLFPGFSALVPCLGTALILYFARAHQGIVGNILAYTPIVYVGRISYPAYLWHWPIIAFLNVQLVVIDALVGAVVLGVTLMLAALTYHALEQPFRMAYQKHPLPRVFGIGYVLPAVLVVSLSLALQRSDGWPTRFTPELAMKSQALQSYSNRIRGRCNEGNVTQPLSEDDCILGDANRPVDFLLVGDSHANHFTGMMDYLAREAGLRGWDITQSQTIFLPGVRRFYQQDGNVVEHGNFALRNQRLEQLIADRQFKAVVLGGSFMAFYGSEELTRDGSKPGVEAFEAGFHAAVGRIIQAGAIPYIITGTPALEVPLSHDCTLNNARFGKDSDCTFSTKVHLARSERWRGFLGQLKEQYPQIVFIEPEKIICDESVCRSEIDGLPLYRDRGHLNHLGSELIGKIYLSHFGNPLTALKRSEASARASSDWVLR